MKIAIAQMNTRPGDFEVTVPRMLAQIHAAAEQGAELVVFPTPTLTGPTPGGLTESEGFAADLMTAMADLAERAEVPALVPVVLGPANESSVEAVLLRDGQPIPLRLVGMQGSLHAGTEPGQDASFQLDGIDVGVALDRIMLDRYTSGGANADIVVYLPPYCLNTNDETTALAASVADGCFVNEASDANSWLVVAGGVGGYDEQVFSGSSFVMAPWGELALVLPAFEEALAVVDAEILGEGPLEHPVTPPSYQRIPHLWDALVVAARDLFHKEGLGTCGIVLTGDLPTSALAALMVDALGPTRVRAVIAPVDAEALADARQLARNLRIEAEEISTANAAAFWRAVGGDPNLPPDALAVARATLAARARALGWNVVLPADKTAFALEADVACAAGSVMAPFGDVYRTDLCALARHRNTVSPVIPLSALARVAVPPVEGSALAGVTTEARLNAIDAILLLHVERGLGLTAISHDQPQPALVASVLERMLKQEPYRRAFPTTPVVSDRTLAERDWPLGIGWRDHERDDAASLEALGRIAERMMGELLPEDAKEDVEREMGEQFSEVMGMLHEMGLSGNEPSGNDLFDSGLFSSN